MLWLTDERDDEDISAPISRIIWRRLPVGSDELGNPDLGDAVAAAIALWAYGRKQAARLREWRRLRRAQQEGPDPDDTD